MANWPGIYKTGTATVEQGSTTVTFQGAGLIVEALKRGDWFGAHDGLAILIDDIGTSP